MTARLFRSPRWAWGALLVASVLVAYLPAIRGDFLWDDDQYVTQNRAVQSASGIVDIWIHPWSTPQYYPVTLTSFWLEYRLWGASPLGYHLTNALLHALSALLLWRILARLELPGAGVAAAIFALHPVQVESVAWITERKNVLAGVFYLLSLDAWLSSSRRHARAFVFFLCALLSKSVASSLPAAILLLVWWKRGRITLRDALPLAPFFVAGAAMGTVTAWLEKHRVGAWGPDWDLSLLERILVAGRALWFYVGKLVWPDPLLFVYPRFTVGSASALDFLPLLGVVLVLAALWAARDKLGRGPLTACLFFVGTLVPALSFVNVFPMLYSFVADHFQYMACIGPIALVVASAAKLTRRTRPFVPALLAGAVLAILAAATASHAGTFSGVERLWRDTLAGNPSAFMAHTNLAGYLHVRAAAIGDDGTRRRMLEEAEREYRAAIALKPDDLPPRLQLGKLYEERGDLARAEAEYETATQIPNRYPPGSRGYLRAADPWYVKGRFLADRGRTREAIPCLRRAVEIHPDSSMFRSDLGKALFESGEVQDGKEQILEAVRLDPESTPALNNLAVVLASEGSLDEAIRRWSEVLRLDPSSAEAHNNLGTALLLLGRPEEAVPHFLRALELRPGFDLARRNLEDARGRLHAPPGI